MVKLREEKRQRKGMRKADEDNWSPTSYGVRETSREPKEVCQAFPQLQGHPGRRMEREALPEGVWFSPYLCHCLSHRSSDLALHIRSCLASPRVSGGHTSERTCEKMPEEVERCCRMEVG